MAKYTLINDFDSNVRIELAETDALEAALEALEHLGYSMSENIHWEEDTEWDMEAAEAEYLKDCKNGLYPDKADIAN